MQTESYWKQKKVNSQTISRPIELEGHIFKEDKGVKGGWKSELRQQ